MSQESSHFPISNEIRDTGGKRAQQHDKANFSSCSFESQCVYTSTYTLQAIVYTEKAQSTDKGPQTSLKPTSWGGRTSGHPGPTSTNPGPQGHKPGSPRCARCTEAGRMGLGTAHPCTKLSSSCSQETAVRGCRDLGQGLLAALLQPSLQGPRLLLAAGPSLPCVRSPLTGSTSDTWYLWPLCR